MPKSFWLCLVTISCKYVTFIVCKLVISTKSINYTMNKVFMSFKLMAFMMWKVFISGKFVKAAHFRLHREEVLLLVAVPSKCVCR